MKKQKFNSQSLGVRILTKRGIHHKIQGSKLLVRSRSVIGKSGTPEYIDISHWTLGRLQQWLAN